MLRFKVYKCLATKSNSIDESDSFACLQPFIEKSGSASTLRTRFYQIRKIYFLYRIFFTISFTYCNFYVYLSFPLFNFFRILQFQKYFICYRRLFSIRPNSTISKLIFGVHVWEIILYNVTHWYDFLRLSYSHFTSAYLHNNISCFYKTTTSADIYLLLLVYFI